MGCMDLCSKVFFFSSHTCTCTHKQTIQKCRATCNELGVSPSGDFVLLKLKKEAAEDGAFLVRWSAINYHRIILAVLSKNEVFIEIFAVQWQ